jgi:methionyl-tRNA formyltransferase
MNITILTDNPNSWYIFYIKDLINSLKINHNVKHIFDKSEIVNGDIMFLLSCEKILDAKYLKYHKNNIVIHPSKLPLGKGWSPLAWQVLENKNSIPFTLFEAIDKLDAGEIYIVKYLNLKGHELNDEIKNNQGKLFNDMVLEFVNTFNKLKPVKQHGKETFYSKRTKSDSELNINLSIKEQFNLLRIVDNERYPAHFYLNKKKYILKIFKADE